MPITLEVRKLTADWHNPDYDRRRRYGTGAVKTVAAGAKLVVTHYEDDTAAVRVVKSSDIFYDQTTTASLLALSAPASPETWREWRLFQSDPDIKGISTNSDVLETLWRNPSNRKLLIDALRQVLAEEPQA